MLVVLEATDLGVAGISSSAVVIAIMFGGWVALMGLGVTRRNRWKSTIGDAASGHGRGDWRRAHILRWIGLGTAVLGMTGLLVYTVAIHAFEAWYSGVMVVQGLTAGCVFVGLALVAVGERMAAV